MDLGARTGKRFALRHLVIAAVACLLTSSVFAAPATERADLAALPESPTGLYIVTFEEAPLATYTGDLPGLEATNPRARGENKLDARSPASRDYLEFLEARQTVHIANLELALDRALEIRFRYQAVTNGIAAFMSAEEASRLAQVPGVIAVLPDRLDRLVTDRGPTWIGAPGIWDGSDTNGAGMSRGEGTIVGDVDSGVNMQHPSFSDSPADGHTFVNPFGSGTFVGDCTGTSLPFPCNDKLIGAWDFADGFGSPPEADGPEDDNGHGTHTASTAAGNTLLDPAISGVAPHANLITYDACYTNTAGQGLCPFAATTGGINQAILDGVDAINYSISGGTSPWNGDSDTNFLNAVAAGIFVAAAAGNGTPTPGTTNHLGPWVATVGASTHDRVTSANQLESMSGGGSPPADIDGASYTEGYGPDTIVHAGDFSNGDPDPEQCLNPFPGGTWSAGEIVMCDRGTIARVLKCANVAAGGAAGCVLGNVAGSGAPVADPHIIPATHIDLADADAVRTWLASGSGHTATLSDSSLVIDAAAGDIMASFSLIGPASFDVVKPDVTNPGVNIFAAFNAGGIPGFPGPDYGIISGTSMSTPHTVGSAMLVRSLHPSWTPSEIKSALMTTAKTADVFKPNGSTPSDPFDRGSGRVDLSKAGRAGLVLDETEANYLAANPGAGGDPRTLNIASMQDDDCDTSCSWTRTVRNPTAGSVTWTFTGSTSPAGITVDVTPDNFTLAGGATQVITIKVSITTAQPAGWAFASFTLSPDDGGIPDATFPIAVTPTGFGNPPFFADGFESGNTSAWSLSAGE